MELVSVVVACYDNLEVLEVTLPEWKVQEWDNYEVIVVDDGTPEDSGIREYVEGLGYRYYRQERRRFGFYRACNVGIWHAGGSRIVFGGSDVIPLPNMISGHMLWAADDNITVGRIHHKSKAGYDEYYYSDNRKGLTNNPGTGIHWKQFWLGNVSIPRAVLIEVNGFDETHEMKDIRLLGEADIARRLQRIGYKIIGAPESEGIHIDHDTRKTQTTLEVLLARDNDPVVNRDMPESWV